MSSFNHVLKSNTRLGTNPLKDSITARTTFNRSSTHKTTFTPGQLIPIYFDEVLPGDVVKLDFKYLMRMAQPLVPTMDNSVIDFHFFYVPNRIVWPNWKYFMGENENEWYQDVKYIVPYVYFDPSVPPSGASTGQIGKNCYFWQQNSTSSTINIGVPKFSPGYKDWDLASYLGVPSNVIFINHVSNSTLQDVLEPYVSHISALPFYAYAKIWNDWYRDENLQSSIYIPFLNPTQNNEGHQNLALVPNVRFSTDGSISDAPDSFNPYNPGNHILKGCGTLPVSKLTDYFTTCLPSTQKGNPVTLQMSSLTIPVPSLEVINRQPFNQNSQATQSVDRSHFYDGFNGVKSKNHMYQFLLYDYLGGVNTNNREHMLVGGTLTNLGSQDVTTAISAGNYNVNGYIGTSQIPANLTYNNGGTTIGHRTLYHDLITSPTTLISSDVNTGISINDLRLSIALQQFLENDARGGTRYIEIIRNHFGVISPDSRLQISEYLGGARRYNNISQVLNQAGQVGDQGSAQVGQLGAFSMTSGEVDNCVSLASTEHGFIFGFVIVRVLHTYGQGLEKLWTRKTRYDYFWPEFANIGEQVVYTREVVVHPVVDMLSSGSPVPQMYSDWNRTFGYNEAWAEYRFAKNRVSGWFSPNSPNYLDAWSYTDNYSKSVGSAPVSTPDGEIPGYYGDRLPVLGNSWIRENRFNIGQTLENYGYDYFMIDLYFNAKWTRALPAYSVPGLNKI